MAKHFFKASDLLRIVIDLYEGHSEIKWDTQPTAYVAIFITQILLTKVLGSKAIFKAQGSINKIDTTENKAGLKLRKKYYRYWPIIFDMYQTASIHQIIDVLDKYFGLVQAVFRGDWVNFGLQVAKEIAAEAEAENLL